MDPSPSDDPVVEVRLQVPQVTGAFRHQAETTGLVLALLDWVLGKQHVTVFTQEVAAAYLWLARATFTAAVAWVFYMALEPYVRRFWPRTIITWSRLLVGHFRDPLVGRDILIGTLFGICLVLATQIDILFPA